MFSAWMLDNDKKNPISGSYACDYKYQAEQMLMDIFRDMPSCTHGVIFMKGTPIEYRTRNEETRRTDKIIDLTVNSEEAAAFLATDVVEKIRDKMRERPKKYGYVEGG